MSTPSVNTPTGPNGASTMKIRRPKVADPLVRPKRKPTTRPSGPAPPVNGATLKLARPRPLSANAVRSDRHRGGWAEDSITVNGFSGPLLSEEYHDFPLVTTKRALREGLKHHIARFASKKAVDPRDETQFTRPVRLQRRDPRARTHEVDPDKIQGAERLNGRQLMEEAEREELEARRAAREKERAENLAQIAPSVGPSTKRSTVPKQKTQQGSKTDMSPEEIARARIKYEEALPWHLEDFDNKNIWVGNYEAALSETHAVFVLDAAGKMQMIPVEKWYKFNAKNQFKALTIEEAEKFMSKKIKDPRWFMEKQQELAQQKELEKYAMQRRVYAGKQGVAGGESGLEADEMDFEEDRFADDEEHDDLFNEQDEDTKAAEKRIKQDQLKANIFDLKDEREYEEEELKEKREREALRIQGKKVRKALQRREKNYDYSSGSDVNPYSDEESSEDSEAERLEDEQKAVEDKIKKEPATPSKGTTTLSGRPKHTDTLKKANAPVPRKRAGSPTLSDASGTDTSRKKTKNKHLPTPPTLQAAPSTPVAAAIPGTKRVRNVGTSPASDVDGGVGSAGEMSEGGKAKKLKLDPPTIPGASPQGSRATSPAPVGSRGGLPGSRASSPDGGAATRGPARISTPAASATQTFPTPAEVHAAIPSSGIPSSDLLRIFRPRIGESKENHRKFIAIVKDVSVYGKEDRLLRPGVLREA